MKKNITIKMFKSLKIIWIINLLFYSFLYICNTFIKWSFENPFQPLIDIPLLSDNDRAELLLAMIGYQAFIHIIVFAITTEISTDAKN